MPPALILRLFSTSPTLAPSVSTTSAPCVKFRNGEGILTFTPMEYFLTSLIPRLTPAADYSPPATRPAPGSPVDWCQPSRAAPSTPDGFARCHIPRLHKADASHRQYTP